MPRPFYSWIYIIFVILRAELLTVKRVKIAAVRSCQQSITPFPLNLIVLENYTADINLTMDQLNYKEQQEFTKVVEQKQMSDFMRVSYH